jgi:DNA-binding transcriptional LysR family regulator
MKNLDHLKLSHLRLLAAMADTGQIGRAAERVGITQPAASRLMVEIGRVVGQPVHARQGRGVVLTAVGAALARRAQRVLRELEAAAVEVGGIAAGGVGHIRLGSVTAPALDLVLPALRSLRLTDPGLSFEVSVQPSVQLCADLRAGGLDLAIGRLVTAEDAADLDFEPLASEPVALVVRRGHPLDRGAPVVLAEVLRHDWVMPGGASPITGAVERRLADLGARLGRQQLSTASMLLTLVRVQQSNAIAPLAEAVARAFTAGEGAAFVRLDTDLGIDVGPYGLLTRRGQVPSPAVERLVEMLRAGARALANAG